MISQCRLYDVIAVQMARIDTSQVAHDELSVTHTQQLMLPRIILFSALSLLVAQPINMLSDL